MTNKQLIDISKVRFYRCFPAEIYTIPTIGLQEICDCEFPALATDYVVDYVGFAFVARFGVN